MEENDIILDPLKLLSSCNILKGQQVADFGCGPGIFSIPIAKIIDSGTVYCFDVLESALEAVNSRAQMVGLDNIVTKRANLEKVGGSGLEDNFVQHVVMRKILVQNDKKNILFDEAYRILLSGGNLLVVAWDGEEGREVSSRNKLTKDEVKELAHNSGFKSYEEVNAGTNHFALIFIK